MKLFKYFLFIILPLGILLGCSKELLNDTSFVSSAPSASNISAIFNITHDNTGLVTITPNGSGAISYDVFFGDATISSVHLTAGQSIVHTYPEGNYQLKFIAHDIKGGLTTINQPLVVSFLAPQNLVVNLKKTNLTATVSATAKFATVFRVAFGDSTAKSPVASNFFSPGQSVTHNYLNAGTYVVIVTALSGGIESTTQLDTLTVGKQISLPVTFDDPATNYAMTDFGGNSSALAADPAGTSGHAMKTIKTSGAQTWAGTTIGTTLGFSAPIPLTANSTKMTLMVYSPAVGLDIKLKLDTHLNPNNGLSVETDVKTTKSGQWETLTFDFNKQADGTPVFKASNTYDLAAVFFDFGNAGKGSVFYFDNLKIAPASLKQLNLPVSFEDATVDYTMSDFGGNSSTLGADPAGGNNHAMKVVKNGGAEVWAGTTIGTGAGFSSPIPLTTSSLKMTLMVWSPAVGLDIKLKLDTHVNPNNGQSVETDVKTTLAGQWETLTFDFSKQSTGAAFNAKNTYDLASVFFDYGNRGTGSVFYFDNLKMANAVLSQLNMPVSFEDPSVDYTMSDFGGNASTLGADPAGGSNHAMKVVKMPKAQTWAGTTIGTSSGFSSPIPLTANSTKLTLMVWSPAVGLDIKLKLESHIKGSGIPPLESDMNTTVAGQWETLTFDFSQSSTGAYSTKNVYDLASVFFDFGNAGSGSVFYFDNLKMGPASAANTLSQIDLPVTFEDPAVNYTLTDFGKASSKLIVDPANANNHIVQTIKPNGAETWAGTTIGTDNGFANAVKLSAANSKMTVMVYSPAAGYTVRLKLEDHNDKTHTVETEAQTTQANQWETLTFDFTIPAHGTTTVNYGYTFDKASIFFDFNNVGSGLTFYWDNVLFSKTN